MTVKRFVVIKENGNIEFTKAVNEDGNIETSVIREYTKNTQTTLDFATECIERFDNEYPDWAGVIEWQMIAEDDLKEWIKNPETII